MRREKPCRHSHHVGNRFVLGQFGNARHAGEEPELAGVEDGAQDGGDEVLAKVETCTSIHTIHIHRNVILFKERERKSITSTVLFSSFISVFLYKQF